jgi:cyclohexanecarboxylate-CoA ligase
MTTTVTESQAAEYRQQGWWRNATFLDDLERQARERPTKLAIAGRRVTESRTDTLDYAELARLADRFAGALIEAGTRAGDFVSVQLPNRWEMVPLMFACMRLGAVICPVSPLCQADELTRRLQITRTKTFVTAQDRADDLPTRAQGTLPDLQSVFTIDGPTPGGADDFHKHFVRTPWEERYAAELRGLRPDPDDPFVVLFTSGTTSAPKGVKHSQNTLHAGARGYIERLELDEDFVAAATTPLCHYSGFVQNVLVGIMLGGTTAFQDRRDNAILPDLIERYGATLIYGPPATVADVCAAQRARPRDVGTLRQAVIGSAPVLPRLVTNIRDTLGIRAYSVWGMSECGPATVTSPDEPLDWAAHSNGRPLPGMEVRIRPSDGRPESTDAGRLQVRGAAQCLGYYQRDEEYAANLGADGWFNTGDLARPDGRNGIRIIGRASDAIMRDGLVAPMTEMEAIMETHPRVAEAALIGVPGADGADVIYAVLVPASGQPTPTLAELRVHIKDAGVGAPHLPDRIAVADTLPRTLTGKVRKAELRQRYAGT